MDFFTILIIGVYIHTHYNYYNYNNLFLNKINQFYINFPVLLIPDIR